MTATIPDTHQHRPHRGRSASRDDDGLARRCSRRIVDEGYVATGTVLMHLSRHRGAASSIDRCRGTVEGSTSLTDADGHAAFGP